MNTTPISLINQIKELVINLRAPVRLLSFPYLLHLFIYQILLCSIISYVFPLLNIFNWSHHYLFSCSAVSSEPSSLFNLVNLFLCGMIFIMYTSEYVNSLLKILMTLFPLPKMPNSLTEHTDLSSPFSLYPYNHLPHYFLLLFVLSSFLPPGLLSATISAGKLFRICFITFSWSSYSLLSK